MTSHIPIRRVFVEGVMIVVSILLAFGIQAWWDQRTDRQEEYRLLTNLQIELNEARDSLVSAIDSHREWGTAAAFLAEVGMSGDVVAPPELGAGLLLEQVLTGVITTYLKTGALDGALASGRLDLVSNPALRSLLAGWPRAQAEFTEKQDYLWDLGVEVRPLLLASVPIADGVLSSTTLTRMLGLPGRQSGTQSLSPEFVAFLRSEVGHNYSALRARWEAFTVRDGQALLAVLDELLDLLEVELR